MIEQGVNLAGRLRARLLLALIVAPAMAASVPASGSEAIVYTYDVFGRLTQSATTGGVDNGLAVTYTLDLADNRTGYAVSGSAGGGVPDVTVMVLPLNGFTIIPLVSQP